MKEANGTIESHSRSKQPLDSISIRLKRDQRKSRAQRTTPSSPRLDIGAGAVSQRTHCGRQRERSAPSTEEWLTGRPATRASKRIATHASRIESAAARSATNPQPSVISPREAKRCARAEPSAVSRVPSPLVLLSPPVFTVRDGYRTVG